MNLIATSSFVALSLASCMAGCMFSLDLKLQKTCSFVEATFQMIYEVRISVHSQILPTYIRRMLKLTWTKP